MKCSNCGEENADQATTCTSCGQVLTQMTAPPPSDSPIAAPVLPRLPDAPPGMVPPTPIPLQQQQFATGMRTRTVPENSGPGAALSMGWEILQANFGMVVGAFLLYTVIILAIQFTIGWIPGIGPIATGVFLIPPIAGGYMILMLKIVNKEEAQIGDLFSGFSDYLNWVLVSIFSSLINFAALLVPGIIIGVTFVMTSMNRSGDETLPAIIIGVGVLLALVLVIAVVMRFVYAFQLAAEGERAGDAIRKSNEITKDKLLMLFGSFILYFLVNILGFIALVVGLLITIPLTICAMLLQYNALRAEAGI